LREFNNLADKIVDLTKAKPISADQNEEQDVNAISAAAKRKDPKGVAEATKKLAEDTPILARDARAEADKISDPTRKKNLLDSIDEIERLLPQTIPAVKAAISSPDDKAKQKELQDVLAKYDLPLAKINNAIKPSDDNEAEALARDADAILAEVATKAHSGDKPGTESALKKLREPVGALREKGKNLAERTNDPNRKRDLQDALDALDKLLNDLDKAARDAAANPRDQSKQDELDDIIHQIKKPIHDIADAVKDEKKDEGDTNKRAASALASLKGVKKRKMDPRSLLDAADELAACLKDMLGDVRSKAYTGGAVSADAGMALNLNDLLAELDRAAAGKREAPPPKKEDLSGLLKGLEALADAAAPPPGASLEQSIDYVAQSISKRSRQLAEDPTSSHTASIAAELAKLAEAVRQGKRSDFLVSARHIAALINTYYSEIRRLADNTKDPQLKERLMQNGQALKNFSVQLKILASVKAASTSPDSDAEMQLGVLMSNFGQMLNATINNVQIYRIKHKQ